MLPPNLRRHALATIGRADARAVAALRPCRRVPKVPRAKPLRRVERRRLPAGATSLLLAAAPLQVLRSYSR